MNMTEAAIRTNALTKRFGDLAAVDGIDLDVKEGEIFGFLGPSGAGMTTVCLLLDQLRPASGHGQVLLNLREGSLQIRHQIGYLPGGLSLYPKAPDDPAQAESRR